MITSDYHYFIISPVTDIYFLLLYSGPIYKLITTELGGERRFAASVARRLESLGALTKGDRRAATGADLSQFNYDTMYGRTALRVMYNSVSSVSNRVYVN